MELRPSPGPAFPRRRLNFTPFLCFLSSLPPPSLWPEMPLRLGIFYRRDFFLCYHVSSLLCTKLHPFSLCKMLFSPRAPTEQLRSFKSLDVSSSAYASFDFCTFSEHFPTVLMPFFPEGALPHFKNTRGPPILPVLFAFSSIHATNLRMPKRISRLCGSFLFLFIFLSPLPPGFKQLPAFFEGYHATCGATRQDRVVLSYVRTSPRFAEWMTVLIPRPAENRIMFPMMDAFNSCLCSPPHRLP